MAYRPPIDVQIIHQIQDAYRAGYKRCLQDKGQIEPYISLSKAYRMYGRRIVERWINESLIDVIKDGDINTKCRISREQIELVAEESNRTIFYTHKYEKQ